MKYETIREGRFVERPNRFIARVELEGCMETVHVKNTGRCRELLREGARVFLTEGTNPARKTRYDLVAVEKDGRLVNMDSNAPNQAVGEWIAESGLFEGVKLVRPETTYQNSRFDFYVEAEDTRAFLEVKGVTLEEDGVVRFPDAPSERAVKHVEELMRAVRDGYDAYILFVVQMADVRYFTPNGETQPDFCRALREAALAGVHILAYDCAVTPDGMCLRRPVPVRLGEGAGVEPFALKGIVEPLLAWYDGVKRVLPWRENPEPYRVWVSEIMLQQTRVEAVKPYYERFLKALPDIHALAAVEDDALLKLWEGLGYYNRARNLKRAALMMEERYDGRMPGTYGELLKLPGIGSYTAGAVASIAFGRRVPAVDGNVLRILSRLRMDEGDVLNPKVKIRMEETLLEIMPHDRPGDFNQALMELGAVVCIPNGAPHCEECPWKTLCFARAAGRTAEYPKKAPKKPRKIEKKTILVIQDEEKAAIRKRPAKGLLAGMYEFPSLEGHKNKKEVLSYLKELGLGILRIQRLEDAVHIFSHKEWHMIGYAVRVDELERAEAPENFLFVERRETEKKYPIPSAFSCYSRYLHIRTGLEVENEAAVGNHSLL